MILERPQPQETRIAPDVDAAQAPAPVPPAPVPVPPTPHVQEPALPAVVRRNESISVRSSSRTNRDHVADTMKVIDAQYRRLLLGGHFMNIEALARAARSGLSVCPENRPHGYD